jgi:hypothetical protein
MDVAFAIFVKEQCGNPYVAMKQSNMQQQVTHHFQAGKNCFWLEYLFGMLLSSFIGVLHVLLKKNDELQEKTWEQKDSGRNAMTEP